MEDKKEIVSLRNDTNDVMIFGYLDKETSTHYHISGAGSCASLISQDYNRKWWTANRNLAAMPDENFGRKCEGSDDNEKWHEESMYLQKTNTTWPHKVLCEDGTLSFWRHIHFLDEAPETYEIGGETYNKADVDARLAELEPVKP